jgi:hypothetical protein
VVGKDADREPKHQDREKGDQPGENLADEVHGNLSL